MTAPHKLDRRELEQARDDLRQRIADSEEGDTTMQRAADALDNLLAADVASDEEVDTERGAQWDANGIDWLCQFDDGVRWAERALFARLGIAPAASEGDGGK